MTTSPTEPANEPPERIRIHSSVLFQVDDDGEWFTAEYVTTEEDEGTGFYTEYARVTPAAPSGAETCGLYKAIEPPLEGVPVQYVGVYVLDWRPEWGQPTIAFVEAELEVGKEIR